MKLHPGQGAKEFDIFWEKIDLDGDGNLSFEELASHFGYNISPASVRAGSAGDEMTDEQILEALQVCPRPLSRPTCAKARLLTVQPRTLHDRECAPC